MMYPYYGYAHFFGWGILGFLVMILVWIIVLSVLFRIFRRMAGGSRRHHWRHWAEGGSALEILKERYAKGEITKEEFDERKNVILER